MTPKVLLLTGSELRHVFFRKYLSNSKEIDVVSTYCESVSKNLVEFVKQSKDQNELRSRHLLERAKVEEDYFKLYCNYANDKSNCIFIEKGTINDKYIVEDIINLNPDIIVSYGCSIIKSKILSLFENRFINIHLGLSPYYKGAGTNFWPFVNNELQFVGTTFMHINEGIDTGEVIHQIRAEMIPSDNIHTIGNRLIMNSVFETEKLIKNFPYLKKIPENYYNTSTNKYYRNKDFDEASLRRAYENLSNGMIEKYLSDNIISEYPIFSNPAL